MSNRNLYTGSASLNANSATVSFGADAESIYIYNRDATNTITATIEGAAVSVSPGYCKKVDCITNAVAVSCVSTAVVDVYAFEDANALFDFKQAGGGGGSSAPTLEIVPGQGTSSSPTGFSTQIVISNQSGAYTGARYFSLPNGPEAFVTYVMKDGKGDAATNNIHVSSGSTADTIDGSSSPAVISSNYGSLSFIYDGINNWSIV